MSSICEIIIAGLSVIVACLQIRLSKQINEQTISREKGYFIIEATNIRNKENSDYKRCVGLFDLDGPLHFKLYGNGDIFLLKQQIIINGIVVENHELLETFFSIHGQDAPFGILLPLKDSDKMKDRLDIEITLILRNITGYSYKQIIALRFEKRDDRNWFLKKKNTFFSKANKIW